MSQVGQVGHIPTQETVQRRSGKVIRFSSSLVTWYHRWTLPRWRFSRLSQQTTSLDTLPTPASGCHKHIPLICSVLNQSYAHEVLLIVLSSIYAADIACTLV